jgi:starch phosphorylase
MIREVHAMAQRPEFLGRVHFIEDYDMGLARSLVAGVDVWLNNPVYPLEASGTSGMKAGINGTLNLSVLDGWWAEGFDGQNGWAIPSSTAEGARRDDEDARSLYEVLQDEVVPLYYDRDASGLPARWIARAKRSMATLIPAFNTRRMLGNYVEGLYRPAAAQGRRLAADGAAGGARLAAWRARVAAAWPNVGLRAASAWPARAGFGEPVRLRVAVALNGLDPADVRLELVLTRELPDGLHELPALTSFGADARRLMVRDGHEAAIELLRPTGEREPDGAHLFASDCTPPWCGRLGAAVRLVPHHELLSQPYELGLMRWL